MLVINPSLRQDYSSGNLFSWVFSAISDSESVDVSVDTSVRLIVNLNIFSTTKTTKTTKGLILFCGLSGLSG
jgi:hypothetical protein